MGVLIVAGGLLVAVMMGWVMPKQYESTVVIQVVDGMEVVSGCFQDEELKNVEVEARRVVGVSTLERVRERLQLEARWDADAKKVTEMLRKAVKAEVREGTDLIEITVRHTDAGDARDVAYGLAEEYSELRKEEELEKARMALEVLDAELKEQEEKVEEKRKMLDQLLEGSGLEHEKAVKDIGEKQAVHRSEERNLMELHAEIHQMDEVADKLGTLRGLELYRYAASLELVQNTASILWEEYQTEYSDAEELKNGGFGDGHPQMVAKQIKLSMLRDDLDRAIKRMRGVAVERQRYLQVRREALAQIYDRRNSERRYLRIEGSAYLHAKKRYWDEVALLDSLRTRQSFLEDRSKTPAVLVATNGELTPERGE